MLLADRTRELSVRRKLNAMPTVFAGKSVLLVDDSIVRGTTMSQIVGMVRKAGAKKVRACINLPQPCCSALPEAGIFVQSRDWGYMLAAGEDHLQSCLGLAPASLSLVLPRLMHPQAQDSVAADSACWAM